MKVYTVEYVPFVMGGSVWQPVCAEVETAFFTYYVGKGVTVCFVRSPNGDRYLVEAISGAFAGKDNLDMFIHDIQKCGDREYMRKQIDNELEKLAQAREITADELWRKLRSDS